MIKILKIRAINRRGEKGENNLKVIDKKAYSNLTYRIRIDCKMKLMTINLMMIKKRINQKMQITTMKWINY